MMDYGSTSNEVKEEYEKFVIQMNPPRVLVDNNTNEKATLILVDSINKHGSLLQVVQVLNDFNLMIKRAYISTDCEWRMDVFHVVDEEGNKLYNSEVVERIQQEYYIRHIDGHTVNTEGEKQRLIICLEAAINRRSTKGLKLELRSENRIGILSDLTRIFQEHGVWVIRAEVSTREPEVLSIFYVTDASGDPIQSHTIESVKKEIGKTVLSVKDNQSSTSTSKDSEKFSFRNLFKFRFVKFFFSLCFIRSLS